MIRLLVVSLSLTASIADAQLPPAKETDMFAMDIEKNIFRLMMTAAIPGDEGWPLIFSYEWEVRKPFTVVLKAGPSFTGDSKEQFAMNAFASAEIRFYVNLLRRIRKQKPVRNFSAWYLSIEQNVLSGPIAVVDVSRSDVVKGRTATFLNIGIQKQFKQGYFNLFFWSNSS